MIKIVYDLLKEKPNIVKITFTSGANGATQEFEPRNGHGSLPVVRHFVERKGRLSEMRMREIGGFAFDAVRPHQPPNVPTEIPTDQLGTRGREIRFPQHDLANRRVPVRFNRHDRIAIRLGGERRFVGGSDRAGAGADWRWSVRLPNSSARRRARSDRPPSAMACIRQRMRRVR